MLESLQHRVIALLEEKNNHKVILDIGCGPSKHIRSIGIDFLPYNGVDLAGDVYSMLCEFPDKSIDYLYTKHFLEHVNDLDLLVCEFCRVLKNDSRAEIIVLLAILTSIPIILIKGILVFIASANILFLEIYLSERSRHICVN